MNGENVASTHLVTEGGRMRVMWAVLFSDYVYMCLYKDGAGVLC